MHRVWRLTPRKYPRSSRGRDGRNGAFFTGLARNISGDYFDIQKDIKKTGMFYAHIGEDGHKVWDKVVLNKLFDQKKVEVPDQPDQPEEASSLPEVATMDCVEETMNLRPTT